jgi:CheY-like chemotaxis protein
MATRHKILVIDDSDVSLDLVSTVLERAGFDVRATSDVHDLTHAFGAWRPDVILTDVNMPGLSGVELCRLLKSQYETAHVPVVLFSSAANEQLAVMARDCDADGFLSKSGGLDRLPRELAALIETTLF